MYQNPPLNEKWIKASVMGTIWAASEIVFGSFLHNLRVPFSGNILTGIGLVILISVSYTWKERGLFWRAGLICAIMKTLSPSAVIFGPMFAIFSEALLLEAAVSIFGRTTAGFATGAMLAMSWNLFQKIMNFIIFYGYNIVEVYSGLLQYARKQLDAAYSITWLPILALLAVYCIFGLVAAIVGMRTGKKAMAQAAGTNTGEYARINPEQMDRPGPDFRYSLTWLFTNILLIFLCLFMINSELWIAGCALVAVIAIIWGKRYKRAMRQLTRPRFWIWFAGITMITAFVFSKIQSGSFSLGLEQGIRMNFRAIIIILGFSVTGTELYNPSVRRFFLNTSFRQLPAALELSFDSLPAMVARMPDFRTALRDPVRIFSAFVVFAESRLAEIKAGLPGRIFLVTGPGGEGKTTLVAEVSGMLKQKGIQVGGVYTPRIIDDGLTTGYDVVDVSDGRRVRFLRLTDGETLEKAGRYDIYPEGLQAGKDALLSAKNRHAGVVVIDEAGILELRDRGWAEEIRQVLGEPGCRVLISVRESAAMQLIVKWGLKEYELTNIAGTPHDKLAVQLANSLGCPCSWLGPLHE